MNYNQLYATGLFTNEGIALNYAINELLLKISDQCSENCSGILHLQKKESYPYRLCLRCNKCRKTYSILRGSIFTRSKLPMNVIFQIIYSWAMLTGVSKAAFEVGVEENTITNFFCALRDACGDWYESHSSKCIGGPGNTVEIDETMMVKRKSNAGRILPAIWVVGGICRDTEMCFAERVPDRTAETLEEVIIEHVLPGTTIHTDMWSGYTNIEECGYIHKVVNHSKNFVNPEDGTHTQKIERFWRGLKDVRKRYQGIPESEIDSHIHEYLWRKMNNINYKNAFNKTIEMLREVKFY